MNIKLASMLTEYTIDVYRELMRARWMRISTLMNSRMKLMSGLSQPSRILIDTAKAVLNAPREMLIEKADLEENTVDDVLRVLRAEFEE